MNRVYPNAVLGFALIVAKFPVTATGKLSHSREAPLVRRVGRILNISSLQSLPVHEALTATLGLSHPVEKALAAIVRKASR